MKRLPVKNLSEVVVLWIFDKLLCALIVLRGDILEAVIENQFSFFAFHIDEARFHLTVFVFNIFKIERADFAFS